MSTGLIEGEVASGIFERGLVWEWRREGITAER
jgi:hypothetical protein